MTDSAQQFLEGRQKLSQGISELIEGTEDLLRSAKSFSGEGADAARAKISAQVTRLKSVASNVEETTREKVRQATNATDAYVHDSPWQAIGIAAVSGLVLGAWLARR